MKHLACTLVLTFLTFSSASARIDSTAAHHPQTQTYSNLPLRFEPNVGQMNPQALFIGRSDRYSVFLTPNGMVFIAADKQSADSALRFSFVGASPTPSTVGVNRLGSYSNYFVGSNPAKWRSKVPNYAQVRYRKLYPGIDLVYYGNGRQLEHDFQVAPGSDPVTIRIALENSHAVTVNADGSLEIPSVNGMFTLHKPMVYQLDDRGRRTLVSASYDLVNGNTVGFRVGKYDRRRKLIIDPVLSYSTYLGGSGDDEGTGIAVDSTGHVYVTGSTASTDFPLANPYQSTNRGPSNAFVTKFSSDGKSLLYSTYLGGTGGPCGIGDGANGITLNSMGYAYVAGVAFSSDFPVTPNAYQKSGGDCTGGGGGGSGFISVFSPDGTSLVYSTYLGGFFLTPTTIQSIALDSSNDIYVTGQDETGSLGTPGAFQPTLGTAEAAAFVAKFSADGSQLLYCTYLRGTSPDKLGGGLTAGYGIVVDSLGQAFITGSVITFHLPTTPGAFQRDFGGTVDGMLAGFNPTGSELVYSSYLGGSSEDEGIGIAIDHSENVYVTGVTLSKNFPTTPGAFQTTYPGGKLGSAFVTKFIRNSAHTVYSTYLGASQGSSGKAVAVDPSCDAQCPALVYGNTSSSDFPVLNPLQSTGDLFVTVLNSTLSNLTGYSTLFGSIRGDSATSVAVDSAANAYITGYTTSREFPVTPGAFQTMNHGGSVLGDAFVSRIAPK